MMDDKKIEDAAKQHSEESYISDYFQACYKDAFMECAKWMQEEFLKGLFHPASEVPRNDNGKILAFSKVNSNMNAMLNETACYTYQGKQEVRVREYTFTDLAFVEDLLDLIKKGGNHD